MTTTKCSVICEQQKDAFNEIIGILKITPHFINPNTNQSNQKSINNEVVTTRFHTSKNTPLMSTLI